MAAILVVDPFGADHAVEDRMPADIRLGLDSWCNPWVGWVRGLIVEVTGDVVVECFGDPVPGVVFVEELLHGGKKGICPAGCSTTG